MTESLNRSKSTSTGLPFGEIESARIDNVTIDSVLTLRDQLRRLCAPVATATGYRTPEFSPTHDAAIRSFVHDVGALYHQTLRDLWNDTPKTYRVVRSLWKCFWHSLWVRDLSPVKYTARIGLPFIGEDGRAPCLRDMFLEIMNLPFQDELVQMTGCVSSTDLRSRLNQKLDYLHNLENQFRQNALVILQVGIGYIGLVLGFIFFTLSCLLTLWTFCASKG